MITDNDFNKNELVDGIENMAAALETENVNAVATWAVDATLRYVVDWLQSTGHSAKADILERLGEVE